MELSEEDVGALPYLNDLVEDLDSFADPLAALDGVQIEDVVTAVDMRQPTEAGLRAAADFWRCAREAGFQALCDALSFCGLRQELPQLFAAGVTILAPADAAFAQLARRTRCNAALVRQLLLAHLCSGVSMLSDLQNKRCAVALAGQARARTRAALPLPARPSRRAA